MCGTELPQSRVQQKVKFPIKIIFKSNKDPVAKYSGFTLDYKIEFESDPGTKVNSVRPWLELS